MRGSRLVAAVLAILAVGAIGFGVFLFYSANKAAPEGKPAQPTQTSSKAGPAESKQSPPESQGSPAAQDAQPTSALRVYGTVTDGASGAPIANATVSPVRQGRRFFRGAAPTEEPLAAPEAQSNAAGAFSLELPASSYRRVGCLAKGYARTQLDLPEGDARDIRLDFQLQPGSSISGKVTDVATGQGVNGVNVDAGSIRETGMERMRRRFGGRDAFSATTLEDGSYTIEGLQLGSYRVAVRARKAGYLFKAEDALTVPLEQAGNRDGVNFAVERGAVVQGVVRNPKNEPVSGVEVNVIPARIVEAAMKSFENFDADIFADLNARTEDNGAFQIAALDFDTDYRLHGGTDEYAPSASEPFRIARGKSPATVDLTLTAGSRVSGTVQFADKTPAPSHPVRLQPSFDALMSGTMMPPRRTESDDKGAFTFEHVPAGKYMASAGNRMRGFFPGRQEGALTVEVDGVNDVTGLLVTAEAKEEAAEEDGTGIIEGTVLAPTGTPAANAPVEAAEAGRMMRAANATTDSNGAFRLERLRARPYDLSVVCDMGRGEQKGVAVGSKVTIRLSPPTTVSGTVVDDAGNPAVACAVSIEESRSGAGQGMADMMRNMLGRASERQETDPAGFFEFKNVRPGDYVVKAKTSSQGVGQSEPFALAAGAEYKDLRIVLDSGVEFSGIVADRSGRPVMGAQVSLVAGEQLGPMLQIMRSVFQGTAGAVSSDESGRFTISQIQPGTYSVVASHPGYAKSVQSGVEVRSGQDVSGYSIVLGPGGTAGGQYLVQGEPQPGVMIQVIGVNGMHMTTTDASGRFNLSGIAPGPYLVSVVDMGAQTTPGSLVGINSNTRVVDIEEGRDTNVDLSHAEGVPVAGTVTGDDLGNIVAVSLHRPGSPAPESLNPMDINVVIDYLRSSGGQALVGPDGSFQLGDVAPGTYTLDVFSTQVDFENPDIGGLLNTRLVPLLRQEITVGSEPLSLNLAVPASADESPAAPGSPQ